VALNFKPGEVVWVKWRKCPHWPCLVSDTQVCFKSIQPSFDKVTSNFSFYFITESLDFCCWRF